MRLSKKEGTAGAPRKRFIWTRSLKFAIVLALALIVVDAGVFLHHTSVYGVSPCPVQNMNALTPHHKNTSSCYQSTYNPKYIYDMEQFKLGAAYACSTANFTLISGFPIIAFHSYFSTDAHCKTHMRGTEYWFGPIEHITQTKEE